MRPLQSVLNAAIRVISRRCKYDHISDIIFDQLHWLPIIQGIEYKLCSLVFKCLQQSWPKYLSEMRHRSEMRQFISDMPGSRNLHSAAHEDLVELRTKTSTYGLRNFAVCVQKTWNISLLTICDHSLSVGHFNRRLKIEFFYRAYQTVNIALAWQPWL